VERDDVRPPQELPERDGRCARCLDLPIRHVRISHEDRAAEGSQPLDDLPSNPAEADHADGLGAQRGDRSAQDAVHVVRVLHPGAGAEVPIELHDPPVQGEDQRQRVVGDLLGAVVREMRDDHAMLRGRVEVDLVEADGVAADDLAAREGRKRRARQPLA
jgi:hypothetical protein